MMKRVFCSARFRRWPAVVLALSVLLISVVATGAVRRQGQWPSADKTVSLEARGITRSQALQKLAEAAGWSLVVHAPPGDPVDLHVKGQPASKVLEMLLTDGDYVAERSGDLVSIARDPGGEASTPAKADGPAPAVSAPPVAAAPSSSATGPQLALPVPPVPPTPPTPPAPVSSADDDDEAPERGEDRVITGGSLRIEKGESVHDVVLLGGSVDILGDVTGDVVVTGGSVHLFSGAHVRGDVTALGGSIDVDDGARVDGDLGVVGGRLNKAEGAQVGGTIKKVGNKRPNVHVNLDKSGAKPKIKTQLSGAAASLASRIGGAITRSALLFVFGAIFLALTAERMERLQAEIAARPMRSFALGIVGGLLAILLFIAMIVTLIGIPFAFLGVIVATLGGYVGISAVLATVGGALLGHRTKNPYLHLALGCLLLLVLGAIPVVGGVLTAIVVLVGLGALVATRGAGLLPRKDSHGPHPYRAPA